jgi:hypothetical protein
VTGDALRATDPGMGWWLDQIRPDGDATATPSVHVTPEGHVYARGASIGDVLDAVQAWHDERPPSVGLAAVVDALTPDPVEAARIVDAVLADPAPEGLTDQGAAAAQQADRESVWDDKPWGTS